MKPCMPWLTAVAGGAKKGSILEEVSREACFCFSVGHFVAGWKLLTHYSPKYWKVLWQCCRKSLWRANGGFCLQIFDVCVQLRRGNFTQRFDSFVSHVGLNLGGMKFKSRLKSREWRHSPIHERLAFKETFQFRTMKCRFNNVRGDKIILPWVRIVCQVHRLIYRAFQPNKKCSTLIQRNNYIDKSNSNKLVRRKCRSPNSNVDKTQ